MNTELKHIPTNIITGFLGVGKTTAILHALKHKPENETWAVLVNEFGKIGIDGEVLQNQGAMIKEIPGGCMCCAAGVNMKVGLNALIKQARPHRLLIEPTGIGHPREILKILSESPYDTLLDMQACICLLDPRHLQDARYLQNDNFNQQIAIADVLIANKTDQCGSQQPSLFHQLLLEHSTQHSAWIQHGELDIKLLNLPHRRPNNAPASQHHHTKVDAIEEIRLNPGEAFRRIEHHEGNTHSCGWLFSDQIFDFEKLISLLSGLQAERIKATVITSRGSQWLNCIDNDISTHKLNPLQHSRIEIISHKALPCDELEQSLLNCLQRI